MVIKREVAYGIVRGLSKFWNCEELQDFSVTVGETKFGCHKLLLGACSGFFRALFKSGMREAILNCVTIEDISSETFQLILEAIYTGHGILTEGNIIDIWRAAHQLQVTFMVSECEEFVLKSLCLENYVQYFHHGRMLDSEIVTETVWRFSLKHCNSFFKTSYFLELPLVDVERLIKSQMLAPTSEDEVLKAILMWVQYKPSKEFKKELESLPGVIEKSRTIKSIRSLNESENLDTIDKLLPENPSKSLDLEEEVQYDNSETCEISGKSRDTVSNSRKQYFCKLLMNTRTCLASQECLEMLQCHPLVSENKQSQDVITSALLYKGQISKRTGHWPKGATHRDNSVCENVAVHVRNDGIMFVYQFSNNKWKKCSSFGLSNHSSFGLSNQRRVKFIVQLMTIDGSVYSFSIVNCNNDNQVTDLRIFCLTKTGWLQLDVSINLKSTIFFVVAVDEFIYILQKNKFWKLKLLSPSPAQLPDLPVDQPMCHVTEYDQKIIAFYSVSTEGGVKETAVLCFDVLKNIWTLLNNLEGPADGMTSFKDDHLTYLLQSNGDLWKLVKPQSDNVDFVLVAKLWCVNWPLHGALIFMDKLYLYGTKSETLKYDPQKRTSVVGLFKKIIYLESLESECTKAMFVPLIAQRNLLL